MSRPFSYNDENFTVIGNLLFCHIMIDKDVPVDTNIIEIPPAIASRLIYFSNLMFRLSSKVNNKGASNAAVGVRVTNNRYFLISSSNIVATTSNYLVGFYLLKDI